MSAESENNTDKNFGKLNKNKQHNMINSNFTLIDSKDSTFSRSFGNGESMLDYMFPLPLQTDKSLCRDAYLKLVLASYNKIEEEMAAINAAANTSDSSQNLPVLVVPNAKQKNQSIFKSKRLPTSFISSDSKKLNETMDINEIMLMRYRYLLSDTGNQNICFQIENLKSQLIIVRDNCCGKLDPMYKIFNWSIMDHLAMFETRRNTVYLDLLEREKTEEELDRMKLKVDIIEIIRLLDTIQDDIQNKKDPCQSSLPLLKHTQHDIVKYLTAPFENLQMEHDDLALAVFQFKPTPLVTSQLAERRQYVKMKRLETDYLQPIEVRYSINLAYDCVEQANFGNNLAQKAIIDELAKIELLTKQDFDVWQSCQMTYSQSIADYKYRIEKLQSTYDEDLERIENELQEMRSNVQKCKEDLLYYQDQVQFFRNEVTRVLDLIAHEQMQQKFKKVPSKRFLMDKQHGKNKSTRRKK